MAKLSLTELKSWVASYVNTAKVATDSWSAAYETITGMVETLGKIFTIESLFVDKLAMFQGEYLSYGKAVEEWKNDLIMPSSFDPTGANALSPSYLSFRKPNFSFTQGRVKIKVTIPNNEFEKVVHNEGQYAEIVSAHAKALNDSQIVYEYALKRQLVGVMGDLAYKVDTGDAGVVSSFAISTAYGIGEFVKDSGNIYVVMVSIPASNTDNASTLAAAGKIVKLTLGTDIAKPVNTTTGEAFVEQLKKDTEIASDINEGNSLNGVCLGATAKEGLVLLVRQGIMPNLEVYTQAGAFHQDKVAIPTEIVVLPDFGNLDSKVYAILCDKRAVRDFPTYRATRENMNGDGDFMNYFRHLEDTAHFSRSTYLHVYYKS